MTASAIVSSRKENPFALFLLSSVFFTWGFLTALNSVLIPHLQEVFELSYTQSMLIQVVFSSSPLFICLPTAKLMNVIGYKKTLIAGLGLVIAGTLAFFPATEAFSYPLVLLAVMITALGVAALQVVANPYVAALGDSKSASVRLTMTSGINSLGTTVAPYVGALMLFSASSLTAEAQAALVQAPYLLAAGFVLLLALTIKLAPLPEPLVASESRNEKATVSLRQHRHLLLGIIAIFCYTGAEVSTGTFLMSYLSDMQLGGYDRVTAGKLVSFYWGGAMVGRLLGSILFRYLRARKALLFNVGMALFLLSFAIGFPGRSGGWALIALGLCNSIMYPVIFSLAVANLGNNTAKASGVLVMAGVGGAVVPLLQALIADQSGLVTSLMVPVGCYLMILFYGQEGWKQRIIGDQSGIAGGEILAE